MNRRDVLAGVGVCAVAACATPLQPAPSFPETAEGDLLAMAHGVRTRMAYPIVGPETVDEIVARLRPRALAAKTEDQHLALAEEFVEAIGDHHVFLNTNSDASPRLYPVGVEVSAARRDGRAVLAQVRAGSAAHRAGLRPGMTIVAISGAPPFDGMRAGSDAWANFFLTHKLAGRHNRDAIVTVLRDGAPLQVTLTPPPAAPADPVSLAWPAARIAHVRINDRLGDTALVPAFDRAMQDARAAQTIILDLRDTPSGGDSSIAKPVMSWFVHGERGYQIHADKTRRWTETVVGRADSFTGRLLILVDGWTGSMGEGVAIGLRAAAGARLVGTRMAGLRGAMASVPLAGLGAALRIPVERLFAVDGTPREAAMPDTEISEQALAASTGEDVTLQTALSMA